MAEAFDIGFVIDGIVALIAIEALVLVALRTFCGVGPTLSASLANGMSGAAILLAMRAALSGASFALIGTCLFAALIAHLTDLAVRWRSAPRANVDAVISQSALGRPNLRLRG